MKINVVNSTGNVTSSCELNEKIWGVTPHQQAQFDTLISRNAAIRQGTHKVKHRGEVSGGGRKPWKQKGTGNARQGSIRAPQWKGGGTVFGPTIERNYLLKVNKKVRVLALKSALSAKLQNNNLYIIDELAFKAPSTKMILEILSGIKMPDKKTLIIVDSNNKDAVTKSTNNLKKIHAIADKWLNIYDLLHAEQILITAEALKNIEEALS